MTTRKTWTSNERVETNESFKVYGKIKEMLMAWDEERSLIVSSGVPWKRFGEIVRSIWKHACLMYVICQNSYHARDEHPASYPLKPNIWITVNHLKMISYHHYWWCHHIPIRWPILSRQRRTSSNATISLDSSPGSLAERAHHCRRSIWYLLEMVRGMFSWTSTVKFPATPNNCLSSVRFSLLWNLVFYFYHRCRDFSSLSWRIICLKRSVWRTLKRWIPIRIRTCCRGYRFR